MANIKEIVDSKEKLISSDASNPGFPSVKKMRESQAAGSEGTGTRDETFNEMLGDFNQGIGASNTADDSDSPSGKVEPRAWMP